MTMDDKQNTIINSVTYFFEIQDLMLKQKNIEIKKEYEEINLEEILIKKILKLQNEKKPDIIINEENLKLLDYEDLKILQKELLSL